MKIVVAMSGGVDSSVAAALLKAQGHEVSGVTLKVWQAEKEGGHARLPCCGVEAVLDASLVAKKLGIPHQAREYREEFRELVIKNFVEEYREGRTPNPCVVCNDKVKFERLLQAALESGAAALATGHYARVEKGPDGLFRLLKAKDAKKDQTYFLYRLTQAQISRVMFPLGGMAKEETRQAAARFKLVTASKPESMDICFVPGGGAGDFVANLEPEAGKEGPILDLEGRELGRHKGLAYYTVGQRKSLGLAGPERTFVVGLDRIRNAVIVGKESDLLKTGLEVGKVNWIAGAALPGPLAARVKIRSTQPEAGAILTPLGSDRARVVFEKPVRAVAPGQSAVFYVDDECIGGGEIL